MEAAIAVRNISKTYAQGEAAMRALDGVDLDVRRGELALLMGPSGSGKTTLLSIMGCILRPSGGTIRLLGRQFSETLQLALAQAHANDDPLAPEKIAEVERDWRDFLANPGE